ncbi:MULTISPECIES: DUF1488 family protein [Oxalobacteraceae]|jgi:hypothetical protein|uniref:DUF1488 family protein n=1 Tax=Oxalobacteraceae TaxID=75682 RepID=UPI0010A396B3|nr:MULTISPECIES: DUF1488 family protein [Oxalobacteraceae]
MSHIPQPRLTNDGVAFTVTVESVTHKCVVTNDAIHTLSAMKNIADADVDMMHLFHAYEATISGVARRLVAAGVPGHPLVMRSNTFCAPRTA